MNDIKSLYIHIPFCDHICIYCDFYKMIAKEKDKIKYIKYLIRELDFKTKYLSNIETIFIGGGTPSSLSLDLFEELLYNLNSKIDLDKAKEFTIECNPNDINSDFLSLLKKYKVNRISLGIQSFSDEKLKLLHRNHNCEKAISAIKLCQEYGFDNINCDLLYGLSQDNIVMIKNDLDTCIKLNIKHLSVYTLIIEDKTILNKFLSDKNIKILDDDFEADIYEFVNSYLKGFGFNHYEVSNYALYGYESIHNLCYWNNDNYLGIGANSSYYINNVRYTNINNLDKYYSGIDNSRLCYKEKIKLSKQDMMFEEIMLGLRKIQGINIKTFQQKYNCDITKVYPNITNLITKGYLEQKDDYIYCKEKYIYCLNKILLEIYE